MCDRLIVMQHGATVEELTRDALRAHRADTAYTRQLLAASEGYTPAS
jgi:peptide/nickel transport system ATP-binding protein